MHQFLVRVIAALLMLEAFVRFADGVAGSGGWMFLYRLAWALFLFATAVGVWRFRGWAWFVTTFRALVHAFWGFVSMIVAIDAHQPVTPSLARMAIGAALLAYLAGYQREVLFRPHIAAEHA